MLSYYNFLKQDINVVITHPIGSQHPLHKYFFPINYGYIPNTVAEDGEPIGAYILGIFNPINEFTGVCRAVIIRQDGTSNKLIVVPKGKSYSASQMIVLVEFQERLFNSRIMR